MIMEMVEIPLFGFTVVSIIVFISGFYIGALFGYSKGKKNGNNRSQTYVKKQR